ncbi:MAG: hypothetical protein D6719_12195 [Candidatus Dadabacteria bacterium]|nr:MAG: hypothetical protein D6719_12195 [Candidatus Dadabacteria bacterium]
MSPKSEITTPQRDPLPVPLNGISETSLPHLSVAEYEIRPELNILSYEREDGSGKWLVEIDGLRLTLLIAEDPLRAGSLYRALNVNALDIEDRARLDYALEREPQTVNKIISDLIEDYLEEDGSSHSSIVHAANLSEWFDGIVEADRSTARALSRLMTEAVVIADRIDTLDPGHHMGHKRRRETETSAQGFVDYIRGLNVSAEDILLARAAYYTRAIAEQARVLETLCGIRRDCLPGERELDLLKKSEALNDLNAGQVHTLKLLVGAENLNNNSENYIRHSTLTRALDDFVTLQRLNSLHYVQPEGVLRELQIQFGDKLPREIFSDPQLRREALSIIREQLNDSKLPLTSDEVTPELKPLVSLLIGGVTAEELEAYRRHPDTETLRPRNYASFLASQIIGLVKVQLVTAFQDSDMVAGVPARLKFIGTRPLISVSACEKLKDIVEGHFKSVRELLTDS